MYTALEPSPAQAGSNDIIMANTSSTLCATSNSAPGLASNNSTGNLPYYQRPINSPLQSVHSMHISSNHPNSSSEPRLRPIPLSPPLQLTSTEGSLASEVIIKSSPSPGMPTTDSVTRGGETDNFTSSSCLYNLDTVHPQMDSPPRTDHLIRTSSIYAQSCGTEAARTATQSSMDINASSNIPSSLLLPSEYNNHYGLSVNRATIQDQSSQLSNHQYPSRFSGFHSNTNPLDLHDHQKRINNNNNLVSGYNVVPPHSTATTAFTTPSPSSDSHCESPTTPKMHTLPSATKESTLLCTINGSDRQLEGGSDERDMLSPSAINTSLIPPYHLVGSPSTTNYNMVDIGMDKNHLTTEAQTKITQGKNGHILDNGSSTSSNTN